jgi:hypothetical protein
LLLLLFFSYQNTAQLVVFVSKNNFCHLKVRLYEYCNKFVILIYLQPKSKNLNIFCNLDYKLLFINKAFCLERLRWCRGSVLASDTQVRGFKLGRSRRIFKGR